MIDFDPAAFRLACLKENFRYSASFEKHRDGLEAWHRGMEKAEEHPPKSDERRRGVKEAFASLHGKRPPVSEQDERDAAGKDIHEALLGWYKRNPHPDASQFWEEIYDLPIGRFTCPPFNVRWSDGKRVLSAEEALAFLDPGKKIDTIEKSRSDYVLSRIFAWTGIKTLPIEEKHDPDCIRIRVSFRPPEEDHHGDPTPGIQPHERVLLVNTQKSRSQLIGEFKSFLDSIGKDPLKESRARAEGWQQLEVFRKRCAGIPFENIAQELRGDESEKLEDLTRLAKQRFRRAFKLTQGYEYQPRKEFQKDKPSRICATCQDKETSRCDPETCPDLLRHLDQVDKYQKELTIGNSPEMRPEQVKDVIRDYFIDDPDTPPDE